MAGHTSWQWCTITYMPLTSPAPSSTLYTITAAHLAHHFITLTTPGSDGDA